MPSWYIAGNERRMGPGPASIVEAPAGNIAFIPSISNVVGSPDGGGFGIGFFNTAATAVDFFVMAACDIDGSSRSINDAPGGNTWNPLTDIVFGTSRLRLYWCKPTTLGSGDGFFDTSANGSASGGLGSFSGVHATPFDVEATGTGSSSTASAGSGITPSQGSELIIAAVGIQADTITASSIDSGFTMVASAVACVSGVHRGIALAYKIQTSAAAVDPNWTLSGSTDWGAAIASFKAA